MERNAHREQKWVCVVSQFLEQALLELGGGTHSPNRRVYLDPRKIQVPAEGQSNHIDVLLAIAEGASQSDIHWEEEADRLDLVHCTGPSTLATSTRLSQQQSDCTTPRMPVSAAWEERGLG